MADRCPNCGSTETWFAVGDTGLLRCPGCFMTVQAKGDRSAPRNKALAPPKSVESQPLTAPEPAPHDEARREADAKAGAVAKAAEEATRERLAKFVDVEEKKSATKKDDKKS